MIERIYQAWNGILRRIRRRWFRLRGVRMGRACWIQAIQIPRNPRDILLEEEVALDDGVVLLTTGEGRETPRIRIGSPHLHQPFYDVGCVRFD